MAISRRALINHALLLAAAPTRIPARTVVLTLDDAVKSHRIFVAPLLKELGFNATFFVTHKWMNDREHFMTWEEIAEIHNMGFEIGNHTWVHADFSIPRNAARLDGELALVEGELKKVGVPRPLSFAYTANFFGPESIRTLQRCGYRLARRGLSPEVEYGKMEVGSRFDPQRHHPLLIPTTGDAYPNWTFDYFKKVVSRAVEGEAVILQFHGVPDLAHPWVHTPPERFREYMRHLKQEGFRVMAMRDLASYIDAAHPPHDPLLETRFSGKNAGPQLPAEMEATRADLPYWRSVMRRHRYTPAEMSLVTGLPATESGTEAPGVLLQYPGGRHPRIGFLEGAIDPMRGTKASVFLPWDPAAYLVVDLPEAIFCDLGLIYLAHTHIPTYWNDRNVVIENVDWKRAGAILRSEWKLPNGIGFGAWIRPATAEQIEMGLWLRNGTSQPLTGLRAQICVLLKGAPEFAQPTNDNKRLGEKPFAVVGSTAKDRWIITRWDRAGRVWGNAACPCMHSDPLLPDCAPQQTVSVDGALWFFRGRRIEQQLHF